LTTFPCHDIVTSVKESAEDSRCCKAA